MTDQTTDPAPDRPLVTFALFAYNQERYIREAVEGAFSQTYEPLEIILSDDCSSDRTYQIMQEMAAAYEGPHEVKVRRNTLNAGTAFHVATVASEMTGTLLVVAAGDDVSQNDRTTRIVQAWVENGGDEVSALHSAMRIKKLDGSLEARRLKQEEQTQTDIEWFLQKKYNPMLGPTCAYHKRIFSKYRSLLGGSLIEDAPLMLRSIMSGKIVAVNEPLVLQRQLAKSAGRNHSIDNPARWNTFLHSKLTQRVTSLIDLESEESIAPEVKHKLEIILTKEIKKLGGLYITSKPPTNIFGRICKLIKIFRNMPRQQSKAHAFNYALQATHPEAQRAVIKLKKMIER